MKTSRQIFNLKAFTLIEVIASITIFAVIVVGVAFALKQVNRIGSRVKERQASVLSGQLVFDRLQRELSMAFDEKLQASPSLFVLREISNGPELTFSYLDSPSKTLFETRTPGLKIASYTLEKAKNGLFRLIRSETPIYRSDQIAESPSQVLASGVMSWKVECYDRRNDQWREDWDSAGTTTGGYFPYAVRIELEVVDPEVKAEERKSKSLLYRTSILVLNEYEMRN